ncbi:hydrolase [Lacrimispora indolis]|uniref:hydrolase n=1 Tax=Lacrimispora indolis TaxID=69825 RepID=UPI0035679878
MIYYTSDLHFGHRNVLKFDNRPFKDVDEMDRILIENWNNCVLDNDTVYILGDFCYKSDRAAKWYLQQLKGHKILIIGNHDWLTLQDPEAMKYFEDSRPMMHVTDGDKQICLCHFPIAEWNGFSHGSWHIHGHIHNRKSETYEFMRNRERALNAGCMINNYAPATFSGLLRNNQDFWNETGEKANAHE